MKLHTIKGIRGIKVMYCGTTQTTVATRSTRTIFQTAGRKQRPAHTGATILQSVPSMK